MPRLNIKKLEVSKSGFPVLFNTFNYKLSTVSKAMFEKFKAEIRKTASLTEADCAMFEKCFTIKKIAKNSFFVREGQINREMGFVNSGLFRMYYLLDGKEVNAHFFVENDFLAAFQSFLLQQPSRYYIQALEDSEIITFTYDDLEEAYKNSHQWERFGRKAAELCYTVATERTESFLFMTGEERYLQLLEKRPEFFERIPLYHIASYLGIERESLSRLRRKILTA
jgi:CRP/FNR family transcriptional regulator, anaerobic regulatory protein